MFPVLKLPERRNLGSARVAQPLLAQGTAPGWSLRAEALLQTREVPGTGSPFLLGQTRRVPKQHEIAGSGRHRCWQTADLDGASAGNLLDRESWRRRMTRPGQCCAGSWKLLDLGILCKQIAALGLCCHREISGSGHWRSQNPPDFRLQVLERTRSGIWIPSFIPCCNPSFPPGILPRPGHPPHQSQAHSDTFGHSQKHSGTLGHTRTQAHLGTLRHTHWGAL